MISVLGGDVGQIDREDGKLESSSVVADVENDDGVEELGCAIGDANGGPGELGDSVGDAGGDPILGGAVVKELGDAE